ncbi:RagB/SusD family nutrient uptake outer membrane protein [Pseudotamlana carrageenivorans]|uniref:RagB/SusD family nutrient uptake outer membrane protein n=1 Tax=Pseudotamlana carrageenivorans TaxID=2069432 RepID=A0A2I7SLU4_9FLAO|nr:RagB/SusD family nutrient uptake outer membrane protein [Tamlana carrageenivorans]AUS06881.1 RagB/SusD family nutrient uptake outer membrane protein [Tamlana carrageenivorans]
MKTKNIIYSFALASAFLATSCVADEDLNQIDPNFETADSFWENETDALEGVNAVYGSLLTDGSYMRSTPLLLDLKGDGTRSNSPWGAMANVGRFNTSVADASIYGWAFETFYQGVYRANQVLENVPGIDMEDQALKNRILGQAHFLRGLYFFHLVNLFKNVPLPLSSLEIYHEQKTQEEGWAQVISDFEAAAGLLPNNYNNVSGADQGQAGRATKGAALAYLGKAHLFTANFAEAKVAFEAVINSGEYRLVDNYRDNFTMVNENNSESIFEVQFSREAGGVDLGWGGAPASGWGKTSARAITYGPPTFGFTDVQPTRILFDDFHKETTISGEVDPRLDATMFYNKPGGMMLYGVDFATHYGANETYLNDLFVAKYQNSDGSRADEYDWRSGINERIMRYADVLLMYAECLNELGQTTAAYGYIQEVRDRVNLPDLASTKPNMTQQQMRDQIAHERFLEFALEGHRFDDIRRWGWLQDSAKLEWLKSRDPEYNSYVPGREYFPIPQSEMDNNPLVTDQNTGY